MSALVEDVRDLSCSPKSGALLAQLLHDEVLPEIRLTLMRLELGGAADSGARLELLELEHRLRTRCVEQRSLDGVVTAREVVGLHLRRIRARGASVWATGADDRVLACDEVRQLNHILSVLSENALAAGASEIEIATDVGLDGIVVTVRDDAGGFDLDSVPPGGALDLLRTAHGHGAVTRESTDCGSEMTVVVPFGTPTTT